MDEKLISKPIKKELKTFCSVLMYIASESSLTVDRAEQVIYSKELNYLSRIHIMLVNYSCGMRGPDVLSRDLLDSSLTDLVNIKLAIEAQLTEQAKNMSAYNFAHISDYFQSISFYGWNTNPKDVLTKVIYPVLLDYLEPNITPILMGLDSKILSAANLSRF